MKVLRLVLVPCIAVSIVSCVAPATPTEELYGRNIPLASQKLAAPGPNAAVVTFSADKKYASEKGVPLRGNPLLCANGMALRVKENPGDSDSIRVDAGREISVASVIDWHNGGWEKACSHFVSFTPEAGATYVVVSERIGGKGVSMLWTGVGLQHCAVSVYREAESGPVSVPTRDSAQGCHVPAG